MAATVTSTAPKFKCLKLKQWRIDSFLRLTASNVDSFYVAPVLTRTGITRQPVELITTAWTTSAVRLSNGKLKRHHQPNQQTDHHQEEFCYDLQSLCSLQF